MVHALLVFSWLFKTAFSKVSQPFRVGIFDTKNSSATEKASLQDHFENSSKRFKYSCIDFNECEEENDCEYGCENFFGGFECLVWFSIKNISPSMHRTWPLIG